MNLDELQRRLLASARRAIPSDEVPDAFSRRVMARVRSATATAAVDPLSLWASGLWRAAFSAIAVCAVAVSLQFILAPPAIANGSESTGDGPDLESVLLAPLEAFAD